MLRTVTASGRPVRKKLSEQARECGRQVGRQAKLLALEVVLTTLGYEPRISADRSIDLLNCPFHELVTEARDTICSMNLALLNGVTETVAYEHIAVQQPRENYCCVRLALGASAGDADASRQPTLFTI